MWCDIKIVSGLQEVLHSADGGAGNASRNDIGATSSANSTVSVEKAAHTTHNGKHTGNKKRNNRSRLPFLSLKITSDSFYVN